MGACTTDTDDAGEYAGCAAANVLVACGAAYVGCCAKVVGAEYAILCAIGAEYVTGAE
jgi:hypothetical protein